MDEVYKCKKECYKHFITTAAWTWSIVLAAVMSFCKETTDSAISVPFQSDNLHSKPLAGECQDAWIDFIIPLLQIVTSSTLSLRAANHCKLIIWFNAIPTSEMCLFELNVWYLAVNLCQLEKNPCKLPGKFLGNMSWKLPGILPGSITDHSTWTPLGVFTDPRREPGYYSV